MRVVNTTRNRCLWTSLLLAMVLCLGMSVWAGEDGVETAYRGGFGARAIALGGAFSSITGDPASSFYNPAGLGSIDKVWFSGDFSYFSRYTNSEGGFIAGRFIPGSRTVLALAVQRVQDRKNILESGRQVSVYDDSKLQVQLSAAHEFPTGYALGSTIKLNRRLIDGETEYGVTMDLGARYQFDQHWAIGLATCDVISFDDIESEDNIASPVWRLAVGASYKNVSVAPRLGLLVSADLLMVDDDTEDDGRLVLGVESDYRLWRGYDVKLRGGYNGEGVTAGGGLGTNWWSVDYAVARNQDDMGYDDYRHTVSVKIQPLKLIPKTGPNPDSVLAEYRREQYRDLIANGKVYMKTGEYREAQKAFDRAVLFAEPGRGTEAVDGSKAASDSLEALAEKDIHNRFQDEMAQLRRELNEEFKKQQDSLAGTSDVIVDSLRKELDLTLVMAGDQIQGYYGVADGIFRDRQYTSAEKIIDRMDENIQAYIHVAPASRERMQELSWKLQELRKTIANRRNMDRDMTIKSAVQAEQMDSLVTAIESYNRALLLDSTYQAALEGRRRVVQRIANLVTQWRSGQAGKDSATPQTDAAIQLLYQEGLNYYRNGEYQKAIDTWEKVLRADPSHPSVAEDIATAKSRLESEQ
ncbi:MAG TPA: tetratricopeptide repeat protein [candidate division Zixibacteria bacterium]|nr:tetratricopeptide repeat protein [candidate division Zixibacteria bacterium]